MDPATVVRMVVNKFNPDAYPVIGPKKNLNMDEK
jgi:hypothetical protein